MFSTNRTKLKEKPILGRFYIQCFRFGSVLATSYALILLAPSNVLASEQVNSKVLTFSDAIKRTLEGSPELPSIRHRLDAQQGKINRAEFSVKPEVNFTVEDAFGSGEFNSYENAQTTISLSWLLESELKDKRVDLAVQEKELVERDRDILKLDLTAETARYFMIALSQQEKMVVASQSVGQIKSTIREIQKRVNAGKVLSADLLRAQADLAKRKLVLEDLNHELESSFRQLAGQWGSASIPFKRVSGSLAVLPKTISLEGLKTKTSTSPLLKKFHSIQQFAKADLTLAEEERSSPWRFSTGIRRSEKSNDYSLVAGVSIPLGFGDENRSRIAEVRAELMGYEASTNAVSIKLGTSLFIVHQKMEQNIHQHHTLENEIIPNLKKALVVTHQAYNIGKYSYLELLATENELRAAQLSLLDASLAAHLNNIEIKRLTGEQINMEIW